MAVSALLDGDWSAAELKPPPIDAQSTKPPAAVARLMANSMLSRIYTALTNAARRLYAGSAWRHPHPVRVQQLEGLFTIYRMPCTAARWLARLFCLKQPVPFVVGLGTFAGTLLNCNRCALSDLGGECALACDGLTRTAAARILLSGKPALFLPIQPRRTERGGRFAELSFVPSTADPIILSQTGLTMVFGQVDGQRAVAHLAHSPGASTKLERYKSGLRQITRYAGAFDLGAAVPEMIAAASYRDVDLMVQTRLPGQAGHRDGTGRADLWRRIYKAFRFAERLSVIRSIRSRPQLSDLAGAIDRISPRQRAVLAEAKRALMVWCEGCGLPAVPVHGDYWLGNVLFSGQEVTGVIDWEFFREAGPPLMDALYLAIMSTANNERRPVGSLLASVWDRQHPDGMLDAYFQHISQSVQFELANLGWIACAVWIETVGHGLLEPLPNNLEGWATETIDRPAASFQEWVRRHGRNLAQ